MPNLTHPGGNITGFAHSEFSIAGKWADLLKQMVPSITRVALVFNPETSPQSKLYLSALRGCCALARRRGDGGAGPQHGRDRGDTRALVPRAEHRPDLSDRRFHRFARQADRRNRGALSAAGDLCADDYSTEGGLMHYFSDMSEHYRLAPYLHRSHPQRHQAGRPAGATADQVQVHRQPQDRERARDRGAARHPPCRRRGDRIRRLCCTDEWRTEFQNPHGSLPRAPDFRTSTAVAADACDKSLVRSQHPSRLLGRQPRI